MVSQINYSSIDATYPIAGKDNDSQGFRDNFGYIKNGLEIAQGEITNLQNTSARTSDNNNFNNNQISGAVFTNNSELYFNGGQISANTLVSYSNGPYQLYTIQGGPLTLTLDFPTATNKVYKMRVELIGTDSLYAVGFAGSNTGNIIKNNFANPIYIISSLRSRIFDIWTPDAGNNIYIYEINDNDGYYDNGVVNGADTFSFNNGPYQKYTLSGDTVLTVTGFPVSQTAGKIRLEIYSSTSSSHMVTFAALNNALVPAAGNIKKSTRVSDTIAVASSSNPLILELWSHDGGNTVFLDSLGVFS
jgi:hypothetical protein